MVWFRICIAKKKNQSRNGIWQRKKKKMYKNRMKQPNKNAKQYPTNGTGWNVKNIIYCFLLFVPFIPSFIPFCSIYFTNFLFLFRSRPLTLETFHLFFFYFIDLFILTWTKKEFFFFYFLKEKISKCFSRSR